MLPWLHWRQIPQTPICGLCAAEVAVRLSRCSGGFLTTTVVQGWWFVPQYNRNLSHGRKREAEAGIREAGRISIPHPLTPD